MACARAAAGGALGGGCTRGGSRVAGSYGFGARAGCLFPPLLLCAGCPGLPMPSPRWTRFGPWAGSPLPPLIPSFLFNSLPNFF